MYTSISVQDLALRLADADSTLQLVDVREPQEIDIAYIEGFQVFSLSQAEEWAPDIKTRLNPEMETLVLCHHGVRSAQMCGWLVDQGFTNVKNISGGIDAYSMLVDPSVPRY